MLLNGFSCVFSCVMSLLSRSGWTSIKKFGKLFVIFFMLIFLIVNLR